jgi:hypothetical protein
MARKKKKNLLWEILIFIVKIPYFIVVWIYKAFTFTAKNTKKVTTNHKRGRMPASYEKFAVLENVSGGFSVWEDKITNAESRIGIIIGARGTGKTAFGIKLFENIYALSMKTKNPKKMFALGFLEEEMPGWIDVVDDVKDIKNNSFVLIDEGGVLFNARDAMSKANKFLSELILIARHKNLNILFISQNSANLDINILRQADYLVLKPSSLLQLDFERKKIKDIYMQTKEGFEQYRDVPGITYIYSDLFQGFITNKLPSFWNVKISKSFK